MRRGYEFELYHHTCGCTLYIDIDQAGLDSGFRDDGLHLTGDVVEVRQRRRGG